jgi:hypothetical protein
MTRITYSPYCIIGSDIMATPCMGMTGQSGYNDNDIIKPSIGADFFLDYYELLVPVNITLDVDESVGKLMNCRDHILQK